MEFYVLGDVQNQLDELNYDACGSVNAYDASLKLIPNCALQISEDRASYRDINRKANNVATMHTAEEWVNNFRTQPEAFDRLPN
jgi:hypothetical protein